MGIYVEIFYFLLLCNTFHIDDDHVIDKELLIGDSLLVKCGVLLKIIRALISVYTLATTYTSSFFFNRLDFMVCEEKGKEVP